MQNAFWSILNLFAQKEKNSKIWPEIFLHPNNYIFSIFTKILNFDFQNFGTKSCDSSRQKFWYPTCPFRSSDMVRLANLQPQGTVFRHASWNFKKRLIQKKLCGPNRNLFLRAKWVLIHSKSTRAKKASEIWPPIFFCVQKNLIYFLIFNFVFQDLGTKSCDSLRQTFWYPICPLAQAICSGSPICSLKELPSEMPQGISKNGWDKKKLCGLNRFFLCKTCFDRFWIDSR